MNPFTLPGPSFLAIFVTLALVMVVVCWWRALSDGPGPAAALGPLAMDPYRMAVLCCGEKEAVRIAAFSLADRGLLSVQKGRASPARDDARKLVRRTLELELLKAAASAPTVDELVSDRRVRDAARTHLAELVKAGLVRSEQQRAGARSVAWAAASVLVLVAGVKLVVALQSGRTNIAFLVIATLAALAAIAFVTSRRRTIAGRKTSQALATLFKRLRQRKSKLRPGAQTTDALLLAAVFGLSELPRSNFAILDKMYPRSSGSGSSGSGDGDFGGSSDGGGDSGGGCGGCGGGGCGSD